MSSNRFCETTILGLANKDEAFVSVWQMLSRGMQSVVAICCRESLEEEAI